ncbi:unnamed protein product, partial [Lymnaea stagnalis]
HIFVDGAKCANGTGYGIFINWRLDQKTPPLELSGVCGIHSTSKESEYEAIKVALKVIHESFSNNAIIPYNCVIFTDCQSFLKNLLSNLPVPKLTKINSFIRKITTTFNIQLIFQWIPAHSNNEVHNKVHNMAKDSAHTHPKQDDRKVSLEAAKAIIKA